MLWRVSVSSDQGALSDLDRLMLRRAAEGRYGNRCALAEDPKTPPERLSMLAVDPAPHVRLLVATNPGTPLAALKRLARDGDQEIRLAIARKADAPEEILSILAEDSETETRIAVMNNDATPRRVRAGLIEKLLKIRDPKLRLVAAQKPDCHPAALQGLSKDEDVDVRKAVAEHVHAPVSVLLSLAQDDSGAVRRRVATHVSTPEPLRQSLLRSLARDRDDWVRLRVAVYERTPRHVRLKLFRGLLKHEDRDLRRALTEKTPPSAEMLVTIAEDPDHIVRAEAAKNPSTPIAILEKLARDGSIHVRLGVARNPATPAGLLMQLTRDDGRHITVDDEPHPEGDDEGGSLFHVGVCIASLPDAPAAIIRRLSKHPDCPVRAAIAGNRATPSTILTRLSKDHCSQSVREAVAGNPAAPRQALRALAGDAELSVAMTVADNPSADAASVQKILRRLARSHDPDDRACAARHKALVPVLMTRLAEDEDPSVREWLAGNEAISLRTLKRMAGDSCWSIRRKISHNRKTPESLRAMLDLDPVDWDNNIDDARSERIDRAAREGKTAKTLRSTLIRILTSRDVPSHERAYALLQPECSLEALARCATSPLWLERCAVAQNPRTPKSLLRRLAKDMNRLVSAAAAERLE